MRRAAHLCKADLATQMVVELTSLQGVMAVNTPASPVRVKQSPPLSSNTTCPALSATGCLPPRRDWRWDWPTAWIVWPASLP